MQKEKVKQLLDKERQYFADRHPQSRALLEKARKNLLRGVPMNWMVKWAGAFPIFVDEAIVVGTELKKRLLHCIAMGKLRPDRAILVHRSILRLRQKLSNLMIPKHWKKPFRIRMSPAYWLNR